MAMMTVVREGFMEEVEEQEAFGLRPQDENGCAWKN